MAVDFENTVKVRELNVTRNTVELKSIEATGAFQTAADAVKTEVRNAGKRIVFRRDREAAGFGLEVQ